MQTKQIVQGRQPKTKKGRKAIANRQPKAKENPKNAIFLKGPKTSELTQQLLLDLKRIKHPLAKTFSKRENVRPFEDISSIEYLCSKNDCSLFCYIGHNKKRPHQLVIGRTFNFQMLDMAEFLVDKSTFLRLKEFKGKQGAPKTGIIFQGPRWESDPKWQTLKSLWLDFLRGEEFTALNLSDWDRVCVLTVTEDDRVLFRNYQITKERGAEGMPVASLEEAGPRMDLKLSRTDEASEEVKRISRKRPRAPGSGKHKKNLSKDGFGHKTGTIHLQRQDLGKAALRKFKATGEKKQKVKTSKRKKRKRAHPS